MDSQLDVPTPDDDSLHLDAFCLLNCLSNKSTIDWRGQHDTRIDPIPVQEIETALPNLSQVELWQRGGMGVIYKARHKTLARDVAIKVISPKVASEPSYVGRFDRERQLQASLRDNNIVTVFEGGEFALANPEREPTRFQFMILEFMESDLRGFISPGMLDPQAAVSILCQICAGLDFAHQKGIIHRDLKPENILLSHEGVAKIADFGIARTLDDDRESQRLTKPGELFGTRGYMAPELQRDPDDIDARADLYSLGVMLYEMLAGQLPDADMTPASKISKFPLDARLDAIIARALHVDREQRHSNAAELKDALETVLQSWGVTNEVSVRSLKPAKPAATGWQPAFLLAMAAIACGLTLIAAVCFGIVIRLSTGTGELIITSPDPNVQVHVKHADRVVKDWELVQGINRTTIASGKYQIEIVGANANQLRVLGETVLLTRDNDVVVKIVRRVDAQQPDAASVAEDRPTEVKAANYGAVCGLAFVELSSDTILISCAADQSVRWWDWENLDELQSKFDHDHGVESLAINAKSRRLATADGNGQVRIWQVATRESLKVLEAHPAAHILGIAIDSKGVTLATAGGKEVCAALWDAEKGEKLRVIGGEQQFGRPIDGGHFDKVLDVAFSPDGRILATSSGDHTAKLWEVASGKLLNTLKGHAHAVHKVCFHPRDPLVVTGSQDGTIRFWGTDSGRSLHVIESAEDETSAVRAIAVGQSGRLLASGHDDGSVRLFDIRSFQRLMLVKKHSLPACCIAFSPDGNSLVSGGGDGFIRITDIRDLVP